MNCKLFTVPQTIRSLQIVLVLVAAVFLIVFFVDSLWSESADVAHHFALVTRIAEYWTLPPRIDPTLGEMNFYPQYSHVMAAILGSIFGSSLIGIQLVTLISLIALWASLSYLLLSLPMEYGVKVALMFISLLVLNRLGMPSEAVHLDIHGREIVGNFFYSQLVAQAVIAASLVFALVMDRNAVHVSIRYAALIVSIYFSAGIHLLPALELLCFLLALIAYELIDQVQGKDKGRLKLALVAGIYMAIAITLIVGHPSLAAMAEISKNNGSLFLKYITTIGEIFIYCLGIAIISGMLVIHWFKLRKSNDAIQFLILKYIGLYGLAVSCLCLIQIISFKLGYGSEYAIKKHIFALNTVLILELSLTPLFFSKLNKKDALNLNKPKEFVIYYCLLLPALTILAFLAVVPRAKSFDTSDFVKLEQQLLQHKEVLFSYAPDKFVYLLPSAGIPPTFAYMMTTGVLKAPRSNGSGNDLSILKNVIFTEWSMVGAVLMPRDLHQKEFSACRHLFPAIPFAVIDGKCYENEINRPRRIIKLSTGEIVAPCVIGGFSIAEPSGRWTNQGQATIECPVPHLEGSDANKILIETTAFLDRVPFQRAYFSINGAPPIEVRYDSAQRQRKIDLPFTPSFDKKIRLSISLPDSISPKQVGVSEDTRKLGLYISKIEFK